MNYVIYYPLNSFGDQPKLVKGDWEKAYAIATAWLDTHYPNGWIYIPDFQFQTVPFQNGERVPLTISEVSDDYLEIYEGYEVIA